MEKPSWKPCFMWVKQCHKPPINSWWWLPGGWFLHGIGNYPHFLHPFYGLGQFWSPGLGCGGQRCLDPLQVDGRLRRCKGKNPETDGNQKGKTNGKTQLVRYLEDSFCCSRKRFFIWVCKKPMGPMAFLPTLEHFGTQWVLGYHNRSPKKRWPRATESPGKRTWKTCQWCADKIWSCFFILPERLSHLSPISSCLAMNVTRNNLTSPHILRNQHVTAWLFAGERTVNVPKTWGLHAVGVWSALSLPVMHQATVTWMLQSLWMVACDWRDQPGPLMSRCSCKSSDAYARRLWVPWLNHYGISAGRKIPWITDWYVSNTSFVYTCIGSIICQMSCFFSIFSHDPWREERPYATMSPCPTPCQASSRYSLTFGGTQRGCAQRDPLQTPRNMISKNWPCEGAWRC